MASSVCLALTAAAAFSNARRASLGGAGTWLSRLGETALEAASANTPSMAKFSARIGRRFSVPAQNSAASKAILAPGLDAELVSYGRNQFTRVMVASTW